MIGRKGVAFGCGTVLFVCVALMAFGMSQFGDCFDDVAACTAAKHQDGTTVLLVCGVIYLIGAVLLLRYWKR